jgi:hypothetical protein
MLTLTGHSYSCCDGISRRNFLQIGAPALGLGLADVLRGRADAAESVKSKGNGKSLIVFWTHGGMSQQDTYDMKPNAPAEYRGMYRPIPTTVDGINVSERFPRQAKVMHHLAQVRSVHHENGNWSLRSDASTERGTASVVRIGNFTIAGGEESAHAAVRGNPEGRSVRLSGSGVSRKGLQPV